MPNEQPKTCFVISPIGEDGSDIRRRSDDLLELAIQPALERFNFTVVRADRIARPSLITNDVIQLVQESELCIADLTDRNPNVFYEVGRRHETGRPIVQIIQKDQDMPFDLAGIRTIKYDLSEPRTVHKLVQEIRSFVDIFEKAGYSMPTSGASLSSIAQSIDRLERVVTRLSQVAFPSLSSLQVAEGAENEPSVLQKYSRDPFFGTLMGPAMQLQGLIRSGEIDVAASMLEKSRSRLGEAKYYEFAFMLAMAGNTAGMIITREFLEEAIKSGELDYKTMSFRFGALVHYFVGRDEESEGIAKLSNLARDLLQLFEGNDEGQAFIYNQLAKLHSGADDIEIAFSYAGRAHQLNPEDQAYRKNYESLERKIKRNQSE